MLLLRHDGAVNGPANDFDLNFVLVWLHRISESLISLLITKKQ
jgi:hypothetical protein